MVIRSTFTFFLFPFFLLLFFDRNKNLKGMRIHLLRFPHDGNTEAKFRWWYEPAHRLFPLRHTHTHTHTSERSCTYAHKHIHIHRQEHTHTRKSTHKRTHTHTNVGTCTHVHITSCYAYIKDPNLHIYTYHTSNFRRSGIQEWSGGQCISTHSANLLNISLTL